MKCAAKCNKNLVFVRVGCPMLDKEVKAYCEEVKLHNQAIKKAKGEE